MASFVLLIALSTHAIFEGIALGLTKELPSLINIMIALILHKTAASISLGISLSKAFKEDRRMGLLLLLAFAFATPTGIGFGTLLSDSNTMVEVVFSSFAGGTFIYIAASEVIVEEFSIGGKKWIKMMTFVLGASIITSLWLMEG